MKNMKGSKKVGTEKLEDSITRPKKLTASTNVSKTIRFNAEGQSDEKLANKFSDEQSCAIQIINQTKNIYKIKAQRGGKLYNPLNESFNYGLNKRDRTNNEALFDYKEVSSRGFERYVKFLQTKYNSHLNAAEREI